MQTKLTKFNEYIKNIIKESLDDHSNLIIVDIQPSYESYISFDIYNFLKYVESFDNVLWLYNGQTLGYDDDIEAWISEILIENQENIKMLNNINYFEKEYGYLRALIDQDIEDEIIINIGKYMLKNNISDSRDFTSDDLQNLNIEDEDLINILMEDGIWINNELINELQQYNNCVLVGGEKNACLKEIELFCEIANINFILNNKYIY